MLTKGDDYPIHQTPEPIAFRVNNAASEQGLNSSIALTAGVWNHLAVTLSGNTLTMYVNGALAGTNTGVTNRPSLLGVTTQNYLADSQFSGDPFFNGSLDDFRIYSRALTAAEITTFQTVLTAPQNLTATPGPLQIALAWNAVPQATSYTVKTATAPLRTTAPVGGIVYSPDTYMQPFIRPCPCPR